MLSRQQPTHSQIWGIWMTSVLCCHFCGHFCAAHHSILNWITLGQTLLQGLRDLEDWSSGEDDDMSRGITEDGERTERRGKARKGRMAACDNAGFMLKGLGAGFPKSRKSSRSVCYSNSNSNTGMYEHKLIHTVN